MKVLYVTGMTAPIKGILTGKSENEITGLPGFYHPWYKLVQKGHQVDFVLFSNFNEKYNIKVKWFNEKNIIANIYDPYSEKFGFFRIFRQAKRFFRLMYYTHMAIKKSHYDFVYCKAYEGIAGNIVANLHGIPSGMRSFGTTLYPLLKKDGSFKTALKRPLEYLTFKTRKNFFLMTDDGTKGDRVFEIWKPKRKKYDFLFWKTGVEIQDINEIVSEIKIPEHPYLFFAARFDPWKRHDRVLKVLKFLHEADVKIHLYFAGQKTSENYFKSIEKLVNDYGLSDFVHFLGVINQGDIKKMAYYAVGNIFMYDYSNLGNVFFEVFSTGGIVLGLNDGTLDNYVSNGINGFIIKDESDAVLYVKELLNNKNLQNSIRENAVQAAKEKFLSIDERYDKEVELIENIVYR